MKIFYLNQKQFAERWGVSRQYVNKLIRRGALTLSSNGQLDVVYSDIFMERNGIGVLCLSDNPVRHEQYKKRLEKRRTLMSENEKLIELEDFEIAMIDSDPQLTG